MPAKHESHSCWVVFKVKEGLFLISSELKTFGQPTSVGLFRKGHKTFQINVSSE